VKAESLSLLKATRCLELVARRNVSSLLAGNYRTTIPGRGMDFHEARRYIQGESIRRIDWKITARMGEPYVKSYLEERQREIFILLDISPSMFVGWQRRNKLETAMEIAATLAVSAIDTGDRVGFISFSDRVHQLVPPRMGRARLFALLEALMRLREEGPEECSVSDPRTAIRALEAFRGHSFVIFLISDFLDADVPEDLDYLTARHDLSLLHVYDRLEFEESPWVAIPGRTPEGQKRPLQPAPSIPDMLGGLEDFQNRLARAAARHGAHSASFSTGDNLGFALTAFFNRRKQGRMR